MATNKMAIARRLNNNRIENDPAYDPPWFYAVTSKIQSRNWIDNKTDAGGAYRKLTQYSGKLCSLKKCHV